jgi:hypothetical protein
MVLGGNDTAPPDWQRGGEHAVIKECYGAENIVDFQFDRLDSEHDGWGTDCPNEGLSASHSSWHGKKEDRCVNGDRAATDVRGHGFGAGTRGGGQTMAGGNGVDLKCEFAGCTYEGTFVRQWELQRHVSAKHTKDKPFWCPVVGCLKGRRAPAFARADKLTAHIRAVHCNREARAVCPASSCGDRAVELDLLGVHVRLQHLTKKHGGVVGGLLRAIANAASTDWRRCRVWRCRARVSLEGFPAHVLGHTSEEVSAVCSELGEEGYRVRRGAGTEVSVELECPVCGEYQGDKGILRRHMEGKHAGREKEMKKQRRRVLALVGTEALGMAGGRRMWSDLEGDIGGRKEEGSEGRGAGRISSWCSCNLPRKNQGRDQKNEDEYDHDRR